MEFQVTNNPWPQEAVKCEKDCGFVAAGIGWQCREGSACGRYVHPSDPEYLPITRYYRATESSVVKAVTREEMLELENKQLRDQLDRVLRSV